MTNTKSNSSITRQGALASVRPGVYESGQWVAESASGAVDITIAITQNLNLQQITFWQESAAVLNQQLQTHLGLSIPEPLKTQHAHGATLLRLEPFKCWLVGGSKTADALSSLLSLDIEAASVLDLSHARTHISISGQPAADLLNRHLAIDLREKSFLAHSVASTVFDHVGTTLYRSENKNGAPHYELLLPRTFALSLWEQLLTSASASRTTITHQ